MTTSPGSLAVARSGNVVYFRVIRLGIASIGLDLWDFAEAMAREGFGRFVIDLSQCQSFDSTFMGVLLGVADGPASAEGGDVTVIHPSEHHIKLMDEVGVSTKIRVIREDAPALPEDLELVPLPPFPRSARDRVRKIRDAHVRLCEADERNKAKFGPFLNLLDRELGPHERD